MKHCVLSRTGNKRENVNASVNEARHQGLATTRLDFSDEAHTLQQVLERLPRVNMALVCDREALPRVAVGQRRSRINNAGRAAMAPLAGSAIDLVEEGLVTDRHERKGDSRIVTHQTLGELH